jgi:hypothetical protein
MTLALATTWRPRGEGRRWLALWPRLREVYDSVSIVTPPDGDLDQAGALAAELGVTIERASRPFYARYECLQRAVATGADHVQYADADRLLHWAEASPDDWRAAARAIQATDFLVIGRAPHAFAAHPRALRDTESIINSVAGHLLGLTVDLGGGSRGMSRAAGEVVLANAVPGRYGDAEWPILVQRAGLRVDYLAADLAWETPDQHRAEIADPELGRRLADAYDQQVDKWVMRVRTAHAIIQEALDALHRPMVSGRPGSGVARE